MTGVALAAALALALSACGSTVAQNGTAGGALQQQSGGQGLGTTAGGSTQAGTSGLGTTTGTGVGTGAGTTAGGSVGSGGAGTAPGLVAAGSTGSTGAGSTTNGGAGSMASGVSGPGITASEVKLGIPYCNDCASANAAVGAGGQDPGDTRRYYQAVLDDVNGHGGVLGRKVVGDFQQISVSDNIDASAQSLCEKYTKDTKVAAFVFRGDLAAECGRKAGITVLGAVGTGAAYAKYPDLFSPSDVPLEALSGSTVGAMVKAGWQKPSTAWPTGKIGLITWDDNDYRYAMANGYLKSMHAHGLKETDVRYIAVPQNANAIADASAAISSAVLSFRQKGIDHVFIGDGPAGIFSGVGLTLLFLQNAKSQGYKPRYGFNSNNGPDYQNHPKDQLVGMIAIDSYDTKAANDTGIALNPVRERCFSLMRKKGLPVGDDQTQTIAVNACEIGWFLSALLNKAGGSELSRVVAAGEAMGTSYRSPLTYGSRLAPGRHYGVYLFRNEQFDEGCQCLKYTSAPFEP